MNGETLNQIRYQRLANFADKYAAPYKPYSWEKLDGVQAEIDNLETDFELNRLGYFDQRYIEITGTEYPDGWYETQEGGEVIL